MFPIVIIYFLSLISYLPLGLSTLFSTWDKFKIVALKSLYAIYHNWVHLESIPNDCILS